MSINRRQFERMHLTEKAVALDENGKELGRVSQASGGGMLIKASPEVESELEVGQQMRVTVLEPDTQTRNVMDVVVRYKDAQGVGVEFV